MRQLHVGVLAATGAGTALVTALLVALAVVDPAPVEATGVVYLSGFLAMALAGCVLAGFRPRHPIAWVFVLGGAGTLLAAALKELALADDLSGTAAGWVGVTSMVVFGAAWIGVTTLPLLLFPDGRARGRVARAGLVVVVALIVAVVAGVLAGAQPDDALPPSPLRVEAWGDLPLQVVNLAVVLGVVVSLAAAITLATRWRRSAGRERRQLAWLGAAALLMVTLLVTSVVAIAATSGMPEIVGATVEAIEIAAVPVAMLAAIVDARLFDIDVVFKRSLVYAALVALVVAAYAAAIAVASSVVGTLVASVVVAFALTPVKDWLSRQVETRLYGSRRRPAEALALVGQRVGIVPAAGDAAATLSAAAEALGTGLRLGEVRIVLGGGATLTGGWADGRRPGTSRVELPLTAFGITEGRLEVTAAAGDSLRDADLALLRQLAPQVALVAHAVGAAVGVQRSRERIVGAREAERLRLRRDLHDGLGPALAGLTLQVEAVGACLPADPTRAAELNTRVADGLRAVIGEVRAAVDGLRPADLDQLGLAGALAERARALSSGGTVVDVAIETSPGISPAAEVAAYRIATEALANVVRHARAQRCCVRVARRGADLVVRVEDDGRGYDVATTDAGVGVDSMRARAEEIGGRLTVTSSPGGGTVVEAVLPAGHPPSSPVDALDGSVVAP